MDGESEDTRSGGNTAMRYGALVVMVDGGECGGDGEGAAAARREGERIFGQRRKNRHLPIVG